MPSIEERLQALEREHQTLEQEHTQLKKTIELQTIAIRALVAKEAFEKLQDTVEKSQKQNGKLFDALMAHDRFTNEQLAELRGQNIELDGKIVGLQTEMRQRFSEQDNKVAGLQNEMHQRFDGQDNKFDRIETILTQILRRLPE